MDPTINGALSNEERPLVENIVAMLQQLLSMQEAGEPAVVEAAMEGEEETKEEVAKAVAGEDGESKAEDRIALVTPTTDDSLNDLKKPIDSLIGVLGNKQVQKSAPAVQPSPVVNALGEITKVIKSITEKQETQEKLMGQMFEAMGITEDVVQKSLSTKPSTDAKPIQSIDSDVYKSLVKELLASVGGDTVQKSEAQSHPFNNKSAEVRKNLSTICEFVHRGK